MQASAKHDRKETLSDGAYFPYRSPQCPFSSCECLMYPPTFIPTSPSAVHFLLKAYEAVILTVPWHINGHRSVPTEHLSCAGHPDTGRISHANMFRSRFMFLRQIYAVGMETLQNRKKNSSDFSFFYDCKIFFTASKKNISFSCVSK